jgi:two-component system cell cycle sensor histidine kinase/response regulator CckA
VDLGPLRTTVVYVVLATTWILASDLAAERLGLHTTAAMVKGTVFVLVTGLLLYWLLYRAQAKLMGFRREIRDSEERFTYVVENASDGIILSVGGRFRYLNPAAQACFGAADQKQLLGGAVLDRVQTRDHEEVRTLLAGTRDQPAAGHKRIECVRLDGSTFDAEAYSVPFLYGGEEGAILFFRDLTDRTKAETERQKLEAQFHQAQKLESVGRLAGGIAHDFNNYLTVINGYADLIAGQLRPDDPIRNRIVEIREAGQRAAALTSQLLAFSRKDVLNPKPLEINRVVKRLERMLRRLLGEDVDVILELSPDTGVVFADEARLNQVIMNLAVNARDAMPKGGRITIATGSVEMAESAATGYSGPAVHLSFRDNGTGIEPAVLEHIFEPFFTTKDERHGTGLGLSTVYGIIKNLSGWIAVSSAVGTGTTFDIFLPRYDGAGEGAEARRGSDEEAPGTETILLVEDFQPLRQLAAVSLEKAGYAVLAAAGATEAMDYLRDRAQQIDLLVTDVVMPGATGRDLAAAARELHPTIKVLFMSGYSSDIGADEGRVDGFPLLSKPFMPEELTRYVRSVLDGSGPAGRGGLA